MITCNQFNAISKWALSIAIAFTSFACAAQSDAFKAPERGFVSWQPAANWEHALLSGNGTMGAMVMGQPHDETIILSHSDLYIPLNEPKPPINQASRLGEIRSLLLAGKGAEAAKIPTELRIKEDFTKGEDPFIPAFDLRIEQEPTNIKYYQRSVDFTKGEAKVSWEDKTGIFERKLFVSRPDSVIVLSIKGSAKINCVLNFASRPVQWTQWNLVKEINERNAFANGLWLSYKSSFKNQYTGGLLSYEGLGRIVLKGGNASTKNGKVLVSNADEVILFVKIKPSYTYNKNSPDVLKKELEGIAPDYNQLLARHVRVHSDLFSRVRLNLNSSDAEKTLHSEVLLLSAKKEVSKALIEKAFDAGRYNIISSTGKNPPNLQGIWTGTWTAPWSADFTHDGNLPTAISSLLSTSTPELLNAYFDYHSRRMETYRLNAKNLYGARGIHIPAHSTNSGLDTDFGDIWCLTYWTGAAGWAAHFYFDYYLYTGDINFLKTKAYPFMKEAALFYEDFLQTGKDGKFIFNPSYSPENNPLNNPSQVTINATMDVMIAKQLLRNCISAARILNDKEKVQSWQTMVAKMPSYEVSKDGTIREWLSEGAEENNKHRHTSQLYGLFHTIDPEIRNNPQLIKAASRTIDEKMRFRISEDGGEMAFGLVQLGLSAAHIGEAEKSGQIVDWLASKYWSSGMGSFHNVGELFNTDISGGLPAVIIEMLVYSEPGKISLLPALPSSWKSGSIEGVSLRGQIALNNLRWDSQGFTFSLVSGRTQKVRLKLPSTVEALKGYQKLADGTFELELPKNQEIRLQVNY